MSGLFQVFTKVVTIIKSYTHLDVEFFMIFVGLFIPMFISIKYVEFTKQSTISKIHNYVFEQSNEVMDINNIRQISVENKIYKTDSWSMFFTNPVFVTLRKVPNQFDRTKTNILLITILREEK